MAATVCTQCSFCLTEADFAVISVILSDLFEAGRSRLLSVDGVQAAEAVRRQKLRLARMSEAVRRDEALRTTSQRLRQTDHWSQIDDRQRRVFEQLCDEVRLERRRQRCLDSHAADHLSTESDASSQRCPAYKTRTKCIDEGLSAVSGSSSSSLGRQRRRLTASE